MPTLEQLRWIFGGLYLLVALAGWVVSMRATGDERPIWRAIAAVLLVFGIAKAMNVEEALLDFVRAASQRQHVYGLHKAVQGAWLFAVLTGGAALLVRVLVRARSSSPGTLLALCSFALLTISIAIRLASIHLVDLWVTVPIGGMRAGWWFELTTLIVIAAGASIRATRGEETVTS